MSANIKIDWRTREDVRAGLQAEVKKVLRRHKFPPDRVNAAAQLILLQAEALGEELERLNVIFNLGGVSWMALLYRIT